MAGLSAIEEKMSFEDDSCDDEKEDEEAADGSRDFCGEVFRTLHPSSCPLSSFANMLCAVESGSKISLSPLVFKACGIGSPNFGKSARLSVEGGAPLSFIGEDEDPGAAKGILVMVSAECFDAVHTLP